MPRLTKIRKLERILNELDNLLKDDRLSEEDPYDLENVQEILQAVMAAWSKE